MSELAEADAKGSRRRAVLLLAAGSVLAALLLGEIVLRVVWHNPYAGESPDHVLKLRVQHPNTDRVIDRGLLDMEPREIRMRTDARSYIMPSFQHADPDATVAFLGGSTTQGTMVREDLRFHHVVSELLRERGLRVNTLNAARSGNTLHDSLNVLMNHVVTDRPDIAVLMHATNDAYVVLVDPGYRSRMGHPVVPRDLARWTAQMLSSRTHWFGLLRKLSETRPAPRWVNPGRNDPRGDKPPIEPYEARLRAFVHLCRDFGIEPVLMTQPISTSTNRFTPDWADLGRQDLFNAVVRYVGDQEDVLVIDLVRHLHEEVPEWNEPGRIFWDGMHVNDEGSKVYGRFIARALAPLVEEVRERRRS